MGAEGFPIEHAKRVITFPSYLVKSESGEGFACHPFRGAYAVVLLTDEDSLNRYRHDIGMPERGAVKCATPRELLAALPTMPPEVAYIGFDLSRRAKVSVSQPTRRMLITG